MPAAAPSTRPLSVEIAAAVALALLLAACGRWPELAGGAVPQGVAGSTWAAGQIERGSLPADAGALGLALVGLDGLALLLAYGLARRREADRGCAALVAGLLGLLALGLARLDPGFAAPGLLAVALSGALLAGPRSGPALRGLALALGALAGLFSLGGGLLVGLCLGLLCGLAARLGPGRALLAGLVGALVLSLGATLEIAGQPVVLAGRQLPLPAGLLVATPFFPSDFPWPSVLAAGLAGLALEARACGRALRPLALTLALVAAPFLAFQGHLSAGQLAPLPWGAARTLAALDGRAVHLPIDSPDALPGPRAAARRLLQALRAHDALPPPPRQQPSPYFADPLVPLLLDLEAGQERWALPPGEPGDALTAAGARWLVIHRGDLPQDALHRLDPVLRARFGPPQRDLASGLDLYRLTSGATAFSPALLVPGDGPLPEGYRSLSGALEAWRAGR